MSDEARDWRPATPARAWGAALRIVVAGIWGGALALIRRLSRGPTRPSWSLPFELVAAVQRASWERIPAEGVVAWRNASESIMPSRRGRALRSDGREGGVRGDWFIPPAPKGPVLLYLHGGGYVMGSAATHLPLLDSLAIESSWRVFAPDYRLAPEHPRPAAEDDALAVYRSLVAGGVAPSQLVVAGDSAGGNLAAVLLLRLREAGDPLPAGAVLICPWTDLSCSGASFDTNADADYIGHETACVAADAYLAGDDPKDPAISPLYANLEGLPSLLVQTGGAETLRDQIVHFGERAQAQGVDIRLSIYEEMIHDWHLFGFEPQYGDAISEIVDFVHGVVS